MHMSNCRCRVDFVVLLRIHIAMSSLGVYLQVHERTTHKDIFKALLNTIRCIPWSPGAMNVCGASSDGTVKAFDAETGACKTLLTLNPDGWFEGCNWNMAYGCDANGDLGVIIAGDTQGAVYILDPRAAAPVAALQLHDRGSKVTSVSVSPRGAALVMTAGN